MKVSSLSFRYAAPWVQPRPLSTGIFPTYSVPTPSAAQNKLTVQLQAISNQLNQLGQVNSSQAQSKVIKRKRRDDEDDLANNSLIIYANGMSLNDAAAQAVFPAFDRAKSAVFYQKRGFIGFLITSAIGIVRYALREPFNGSFFLKTRDMWDFTDTKGVKRNLLREIIGQDLLGNGSSLYQIEFQKKMLSQSEREILDEYEELKLNASESDSQKLKKLEKTYLQAKAKREKIWKDFGGERAMKDYLELKWSVDDVLNSMSENWENATKIKPKDDRLKSHGKEVAVENFVRDIFTNSADGFFKKVKEGKLGYELTTAERFKLKGMRALLQQYDTFETFAETGLGLTEAWLSGISLLGKLFVGIGPLIQSSVYKDMRGGPTRPSARTKWLKNEAVAEYKAIGSSIKRVNGFDPKTFIPLWASNRLKKWVRDKVEDNTRALPLLMGLEEGSGYFERVVDGERVFNKKYELNLEPKQQIQRAFFKYGIKVSADFLVVGFGTFLAYLGIGIWKRMHRHRVLPNNDIRSEDDDRKKAEKKARNAKIA